MSNVRNNPIKYLKIFSLVYLISSFGLELIYCTIAGCYYFNIIFDLLSYVPFIIFTVYLFSFYEKNRKHISLITVYVVSAIGSVLLLIRHNNFCKLRAFDNPMDNIYYFVGITYFAMDFIFSVLYLVDCISKFKYIKYSQKIVTVQLVAKPIYILITIVSDMVFEMELSNMSLFPILLRTLGLLSVYTFFVFWKYGVTATSTTPIENALYDIKKQFDNNIITEQEYNQRKKDILNKL